jgi:site-specific recombinase XerD
MLREKWIIYAKEQSKKCIEYQRFFAGMKTDSTRSTYAYNMRRFMDYLVERKEIENNEDYKTVASFDGEKITDLLQAFVMKLNETIKTSGISTMIASPELFFDMNRKIWHRKLVRRTIKKEEQELAGRIPVTDDEVKRMIDSTKHTRDKAIVHFMASTGARPAGVSDPILRMKHLKSMPHGCVGIKIYDESKEGYWAFLTPEATRALNNYFSWRKTIRGEKFNDDTPIFANFYKNKTNDHMDEMGIRKVIEKAIRNAGIERVKKGSTYDKATMRMFRKRFNGKLKMNNEVNSNIAEKLMAHRRGLDGAYLQPTVEECFAEFSKAILDLTIDDTEKIKAERLKLEKEKTELEQAKLDKEEVQDKMEWMQTEILKMQARIEKINRLKKKPNHVTQS